MRDLNLIRFLDFYVMVVFLFGTARRIGHYREIGRLIWLMPGRWPKLMDLVKSHRALFFTRATLYPALAAFLVMGIQLVASRGIWPEAASPPYGLTLGRLGHNLLAIFAVVPLGLAMLALDGYTLLYVGKIDRLALEQKLDQAEYWLNSKTATVVRLFTFGFVNPRKMVHEEVGVALLAVSGLLNRSLWWVTAQVGLRFAFGLSLWLTWAFGAI